MRATYIRSLRVQRYTDGKIWGVIVCKAPDARGGEIKVKGTLERYPVANDVVRFEHFDVVHDPRYGPQYVATLIEVEYPTDPAILPKYLKTAHITSDVPGFGEKKLAALLSSPERVWATLDTPPPEWDATLYANIPLQIREQLHANFKAFKTRSCSVKTIGMDLALLLIRLNIRVSHQALGRLTEFVQLHQPADVADILREHILDIAGGGAVPVKYVRQIADALDMTDRVKTCISVLDTLLSNEENGHTWTPRRACTCGDDVIAELQEKQFVVVHGKCVFRTATYEQEGNIAHALGDIADLDTAFPRWRARDDSIYTEEQRTAIGNAFEHRVSVLTGGPGTGKTTTIAGMLNVLCDANMLDGSTTAILAPTGKAVSRIMAMLRKDKYDSYGITTCTIHRFVHDPRTSYRLVIVDEMSMVDVATMSMFLDVIGDCPLVHLVLAGDADQLPSIGCGNVFADIIESGKFPTVHLTKVHRQKEGVLMAAIHSIRAGVPAPFGTSDEFQYAGADIHAVLQQVATEYKDHPDDLLIITPTNAVIQRYQNTVRAILNPGSAADAVGVTIGDRIIQCKNVYDEDQPPRFNGMMGIVQDVVQRKVTRKEYVDGEHRVVEDDQTRFIIEYDGSTTAPIHLSTAQVRDELALAYMLTVHKAQGSQAKTVVVVLDDYGIDCGFEPEFINRNLIYTAISRAENRCIVAGSLKAYKYAVRNTIPKRRTCLAKWLV